MFFLFEVGENVDVVQDGVREFFFEDVGPQVVFDPLLDDGHVEQLVD